jgi:hypothetical protein
MDFSFSQGIYANITAAFLKIATPDVNFGRNFAIGRFAG